jgi:hypothetical protein
MDSDTDVDVVTANYASSSISVLLASGPTTFAPKIDSPVGTNPFRVAVGHLDADAHPDVVTANGNGTISVLLGNGNGTFQPRRNYATGGTALGVVIADFDENEAADLAVVNYSAMRIDLFFGVGDGTFTFPGSLTTGWRPTDLAVADMNGDNHQDLVVSVTNQFANGSTIRIAMGDGHGAFGGFQGYDGLTAGSAVTVGDFDEDGNPDVVQAEEVMVALYRGVGNGAISHDPVPLQWASLGWDVEAADFDRDGNLDIGVLTVNGITLLLGDGQGEFPNKRAFGAGRRTKAFEAVDLGGTNLSLLAVNEHADELVLLSSTSTSVDVVDRPGRTSGLPVRGYPNPTRSRYSIELSLAAHQRATVRVYDLMGRLVRTVLDRSLAPGMHSTVWDLQDAAGKRVPAGVYLCVARSGGDEIRRRVAVIP